MLGGAYSCVTSFTSLPAVCCMVGSAGGLELLVGADIISTITAPLTFESVGLLAAIVGIRTFLSFSLETEIEGCWPWQRTVEDGWAQRAIESDR